MRAEELTEHPEYPYVTWDLKPERKEKVAVAEGRGGPFGIAYEIHGHGPAHVVVGLIGAFFLSVSCTSSSSPHGQRTRLKQKRLNLNGASVHFLSRIAKVTIAVSKSSERFPFVSRSRIGS